jgi:LuxR family maltose regulon positive regulatory protein
MLEQQRIVLSYGDLRHARSMQTALDEIASTHADTDPQFAEVGAVVAMSRTRLLLAMGLAREALIALDAARPFIGAMSSGRLLAVSDFLRPGPWRRWAGGWRRTPACNRRWQRAIGWACTGR